MRFFDLVKFISVILLMSFFVTQDVFSASVPMKFKGVFMVEGMRLEDYRRTSSDTSTVDLTTGTQAIKGISETANIQTYIFRLNPEMIINDHVTMFMELSNGHGRGGYLGDNSTVNKDPSTGFGGRFYGVTPAQNKALNVNKFYMDIYSDIATFKVGRFSKHWGLGAVFNEGKNANDRFFTLYEGIQAEFSLGKFYITPHWANISSGNSLIRDTEIKDTALSVLYDNPDKDMQLGLYYSSRTAGGGNTLYATGSSKTTIFDAFYKKYWDKFSLGVEIPFIDGEAGSIYGSGNSKYRATAYIVESEYEFNDSWKLQLKAGYVSGDSADETFEAMYLHPNYQVAEIMFRYNLQAINNPNYYLYDSAISNSTYAKLRAQYMTGLWTWKLDLVYATANETAQAGSTRAWNHELGTSFTPNATQEDDLGIEADIAFDYQWNPNLVLSGLVGYYKVGDYYAFNNTATPIELEDQLTLGMRLTLDF